MDDGASRIDSAPARRLGIRHLHLAAAGTAAGVIAASAWRTIPTHGILGISAVCAGLGAVLWHRRSQWRLHAPLVIDAACLAGAFLMGWGALAVQAISTHGRLRCHADPG